MILDQQETSKPLRKRKQKQHRWNQHRPWQSWTSTSNAAQIAWNIPYKIRKMWISSFFPPVFCCSWWLLHPPTLGGPVSLRSSAGACRRSATGRHRHLGPGGAREDGDWKRVENDESLFFVTYHLILGGNRFTNFCYLIFFGGKLSILILEVS